MACTTETYDPQNLTLEFRHSAKLMMHDEIVLRLSKPLFSHDGANSTNCSFFSFESFPPLGLWTVANTTVSSAGHVMTIVVENLSAAGSIIRGVCYNNLRKNHDADTVILYNLTATNNAPLLSQHGFTTTGRLRETSVSVGSTVSGYVPPYLTLSFTPSAYLRSGDAIRLFTRDVGLFNETNASTIACNASSPAELVFSSSQTTDNKTLVLVVGSQSAAGERVEIVCTDHLASNTAVDVEVVYQLEVPRNVAESPGEWLSAYTTTGELSASSVSAMETRATLPPVRLTLNFSHSAALVASNDVSLHFNETIFDVEGNSTHCTLEATTSREFILVSTHVSDGGKRIIITLSSDSSAGSTVSLSCTDNLRNNNHAGTVVAYNLTAKNNVAIPSGTVAYSVAAGALSLTSVGVLRTTANVMLLGVFSQFSHSVELYPGDIVTILFSERLFDVDISNTSGCTASTNSIPLSIGHEVTGGGKSLTIVLYEASRLNSVWALNCSSNLYNNSGIVNTSVTYGMKVTNHGEVPLGTFSYVTTVAELRHISWTKSSRSLEVYFSHDYPMHTGDEFVFRAEHQVLSIAIQGLSCSLTNINFNKQTITSTSSPNFRFTLPDSNYYPADTIMKLDCYLSESFENVDIANLSYDLNATNNLRLQYPRS